MVGNLQNIHLATINSTCFVVSLVNTISAVSWIYPMWRRLCKSVWCQKPTVPEIHVDFAAPTLMWLRCGEKNSDNRTGYQFLPPFSNNENCTAKIKQVFFKSGRFFFFGCQDCPVPVAVVFVYFNLDTATGALTYQFEEENVQHEARGPPGLYEHVRIGMPRDGFIWICRSLA